MVKPAQFDAPLAFTAAARDLKHKRVHMQTQQLIENTGLSVFDQPKNNPPKPKNRPGNPKKHPLNPNANRARDPKTASSRSSLRPPATPCYPKTSGRGASPTSSRAASPKDIGYAVKGVVRRNQTAVLAALIGGRAKSCSLSLAAGRVVRYETGSPLPPSRASLSTF
jgi:hypothetical protein